jgi:hypothetical protein
MKQVILSSSSLIWLLLAFLTVTSWAIGEQHSFTSANATAMLSTAMILIGFFKVRLVAMHFMELRYAPWQLRLVFEAWVVLVCTVILVLYWQ